MSFQEKINLYIADGYKKTITNQSGLDTYVMYKNNIVVRIGSDSSYDHYAKLIKSKIIQSKNAPIITKHETVLNVFDNTKLDYTCTEMELLNELNDDEATRYKEWIDKEINNIVDKKLGISDPFNILDLTRKLVLYAQKNNLFLDLVQSKNIMKRGETFVHIDPFS